jgi:phospholipase/carboxylesterase
MKTDFKHIFIPGDADKPVLLLLHGTGGDESDLVELGQSVAPGFAILSPRGKVMEGNMPRFFKRLAEGVFDLEDLKFRTDELADFVAEAKEAYALTQPIVGLGFSNGANIAASLLLQRADTLDAAILLRAMVPFEPAALPDLNGKPVLMLSGVMDQIIPQDNSAHLAQMLKNAGAVLDFRLKPAGHGLTQSDFADMKAWVANINLSGE